MDPTNTQFQQFKDILRQITLEVEKLAIELDACEKVAVYKGASLEEIQQAKENHLADPEIRRAIKARYIQLWDVLIGTGTASFADDALQHLPLNRKPH